MHAADHHDYITTQSNTLLKSGTTTHSENEKIGKITSETNVGNSTKLDNILL